MNPTPMILHSDDEDTNEIKSKEIKRFGSM
jgi:hypothetical protein